MADATGGYFLDALAQAWGMLLSLDPEVVEYTGRSLLIAAPATLAASLLGIPAGLLLADRRFRGKRLVITVLNTLLGVPTVVVGLVVYLLLSRRGLCGPWELLYTVPGIILGGTLLILPVIASFTLAAAGRIDREIRPTARALGADGRQVLWIVARESRYAILAAVIAAFGRVVSEVGIAMIVGGNCDRFTRTMTTALVLHLDMGNFARALALGLLLLGIALLVNLFLHLLQGRSGE